MDLIILSGAAFAGSLAMGFAGWLKEGGPFDIRKFGQSIIAGIFSAIIIALSYNLPAQITVRDLLITVISGAGIDNVVNRSIGITAKKDN